MDTEVLLWRTAKKKKIAIHLGCKILSQGSLFLISCVLSVGRLTGAKPIWAMLYFNQMPFVLEDCVLFFFFPQVIKPVREKCQMSFCSFFLSFSHSDQGWNILFIKSLSKDNSAVSEDFVHTF